MKKSYLFAIVLILGGIGVGGFAFGYYFHIRTQLNPIAKETDRMTSDYDISFVWMKPPDGSMGYPVALAKPAEDSQASRLAEQRWRWGDPEARESCTADQHRLIWRYKPDRWELLEDFEADRSFNPFEGQAE